MNLNDLRTAGFSSLDDAVTTWEQMVRKLDTLATDMRSTVKAKADAADWAGVNATVSRDFIRQTATEFDEMHVQGRSIRNILRDTARELKKYQRDINTRIEQETHLHVTDTGDGGFTVAVRDSAPEGTDPEPLKDFIQSKLTQATTSDTTAADVLTSMMSLTDLGFSGVSYTDRDTAAQALEDAERAAELAGQEPGELSPEEFDELNGLLGENNDDILFSERFATTMGPEGTLRFWAGLNDTQVSQEVGSQRVEQYGQLQENLGRTLAHATQSDSDAMSQWERDMTDLGPEQVVIDDRPAGYGFQVMSNLMRWGDFDDTFLDDYGNQLMATERELSNNGSASDRAWTQMSMSPMLNRTGTDGGSDPMTGFMHALSNSPDASTEFFNDPFLSRDDDHGFEDEDGNRRDVSNFDYLFNERDWPEELNSDLDESSEGHNAMGQALEAATTGHPAGSPPSVDTFPHTSEQADLYEDIVQSVSEDPDRLLDHNVMSDSMGRISAEYMADINRGLNPDIANGDRLYPVSGEAAELSQRDITRFLHTVGRDPDGYAAVNIGQHNYTTALMEYHFQNPEAYISDPNFSQSDNLKAAIGSISEGAGEIQGTIGAGRTYEIEENGAERDAAYNDALDTAGDWASGLVGAGVGVATAPFTGPGSIIVGGVAETAAGEIIDFITGGMERDTSEELIYRNGERWDNYHEATINLVQHGAESGGELSGNPSPHIVSHAAERTEEGFNNAHTNVENYLEGQGVPDQ